MAIAYTEIRTRVQRRIRADLATASLAVNDLHTDAIDGWANEFTADVINILQDPMHFPTLLVADGALTFTSGSVAFPSLYQRHVALKVTSTYSDKTGATQTLTDRNAAIYTAPNDFARYDSSNFVLTPTGRRPIALIADKVYVKPTTITAGKFTYIKSHPTIGVDQATLFDDTGDNLLILLILKAYYTYLEEDGVAALQVVLAEIENLKKSMAA